MKISKYYKEDQYIHYSNCHEDAEFLLANIDGEPKRILSIASALDNVLAMLLLDPERIVAIDYNDTQIFLCKLKICAIKHLDYENFLVLLGVREGDSLSVYQSIRDNLEEDVQAYFDNRKELISEIKLINCGRFEYYFQLFKTKALPLIHSEKTVEEFMGAKSIEEQRAFFEDRFNNRRFKLMFKIFFSEMVMKRLGRDKEFFKYNEGSLATVLKRSFDNCVNTNLNSTNPYLQYITLNRFDTLPIYLRRENYEKIKQNIDKVVIKKASFTDVIKEEGGFDFMYLSDIFEYMDNSVMEEMSAAIYSSLSEGGCVMFYNMMNPRRLCPPLKETELDQSKNLTFYYMKCYLYRK